MRTKLGLYPRCRFLLVMAGMLLMNMNQIQPLNAAQAPWYWWQSKVSGKQICRQTSPGEGWLQLSQPYLDARCQRPKP
jgi:hypothetical protein